jgi:hypothetical protein
VFVRPSRYERGRAHVIVYNWDRLADLDLDLSAADVSPESTFELRDVQNFFGAPVASGIFGNGRVRVGLRDLHVEPPVGTVPPPGAAHTAPEFAVFVLSGSPEPVRRTVVGAFWSRLVRAWRSVAPAH